MAGTVVEIVANPAPEGQEFDQWIGDVGIVLEVSAATTTITMPAGDAAVTATYQDLQYNLTVNGGTGSGSYVAGTVVEIVANPASEGQEFDRWTGAVAGVADVTAATTTITMPAGDAAVTASYKAVPYTLTVTGGTGSGTYVYATVVNIVAAAAPDGQEFDQWTGDVAGVANVDASSTTITMPAADATLTATYRARQYSLTVNSGTGTGGYPAGATVNIVAAAAPAGQEFDRWIGDVANVASITAASTTIAMPAADITVTATYKTRQYTLTVNSGTGSGSYVAGATVNIVAATAPVGQEFDRWTGDIANVANINAASTFFTMPAANATVTANYKARQYTLTVNSGTGSGSYTAGATVNIVAATPATGQEFDRWTGDVANIGNVNAASTFITMPAANASVTATYRARQYELTVNGGTGSGSYAAGATANIAADPAPAGQEFERWIGDVTQVADVNAAATTITMPAADITVSATYKTRLYTLTVNSGTGSGSYTAGATVNIVADPAPAEEEFDQWTGDVTNVANVNAPSTFITLAAADATVTATYKLLPQALTVNGGTGSGNYVPGTTVEIVATEPPAGQEFDQWIGDVDIVTDVNAASTTITMPLTDATVTATYKARLYTLTIDGGTGSGSYTAGTIVEITAAAAPVDQEFDRWTGDVANVADVNAMSTTMTMPIADATVTATYRLFGGISSIEPIDNMTATGNAGMITSINEIPVSELLLGATVFPNPNAVFPAVNADDFDLNSVASADGQPYFESLFERPVTTIFMIESGANDSGFMQAYDAVGNRVGPRVAFTTASYLRTDYRTGNNQFAGGLVVRMVAPVYGVRVLPPTTGALGFDPVSISAVSELLPLLDWEWNAVAGNWELVWPGERWVLQHATELEAGWSDVSPPASSPYVVVPEEPLRFFRLREASPE